MDRQEKLTLYQTALDVLLLIVDAGDDKHRGALNMLRGDVQTLEAEIDEYGIFY